MSGERFADQRTCLRWGTSSRFGDLFALGNVGQVNQIRAVGITVGESARFAVAVGSRVEEILLAVA